MATETRLYIHVPNEEHYGPFIYRMNADVVECTRRILQSQEREKVCVDGDVSFELPSIPCVLEYAMLVVSAKDRTHVYVVEMKEEAVSLNEIRSFVYAVYGPSSFDKDSLRPYEEDKAEADQSSSEKVYTKGSVFRATSTHRQKTIEAPTDQPIMRPSEESSFSSSSSASREGPILTTPSTSLAVTADQSVGQKAHPVVFSIPSGSNEVKTSRTTNQPMPGATVHEFKEKKVTVVSSVLSKSEMVAPQLITQKVPIGTQNVSIGTPKHLSGTHSNVSSEQRSIGKEDDSVATYTADSVFGFAKDEEKTDEVELKTSKNIIQKRVNFFENCFKVDTPKRPVSSTGMERKTKMTRLHPMAQKFVRLAHKERDLDPEATRTMKDGDVSQLDVRCKVSSSSIPDSNVCCRATAQLQSSETEEEKMDKVHALEHVYNSKCFVKAGCRKPPREKTLQAMLRLKEAHSMGTLEPELAELFKKYILAHCERCNDVNCRVPHMAAGCPHPRTLHDGQIHKGTIADTESVTVTNMPKDGNGITHQLGSIDVCCKIPSTPGGCQDAAQLLSSELKEEKDSSLLNREELMDKVHLLEHAYNQKCFMKAGCKNPPSTESLQRMSKMAEAHKKGTLNHRATKLFKEYISTHCERCNDVNCKVPHMAAGCPHPGMPQNLDPYHLNFTDGQQLVVQATDNDTPNARNIVYLKSVKQPQESKTESFAAGSDIQQSEELSDQLKNGNFPKSDVISQQLNTKFNSSDRVLIFCSQRFTELTGLSFGTCVTHLYKETAFLGRGAYGEVHEWSFCPSDQKFASKHTRYRPQELKISSQLDHENVISLYGVVLRRSSWPLVYQLMPRMTGSFQKEIDTCNFKFGNFHALIHARKSANQPIIDILKNIYYIYQGVTAGLSYLHQRGLVHGDMKASNTLISKPPTCCCHNILLCTCQYNVLIGDFDGVGDDESNAPLVSDRVVVLYSGTLFCRSPEVHFNNRGSWCDVWSIGRSVSHLILGRSSSDDKMKAYGISNKPKDILDTYSRNPALILLLETCDAQEQLDYLRHILCKECPEFTKLVDVIADCLNLDYKTRNTAPNVHKSLSKLLYNVT